MGKTFKPRREKTIDTDGFGSVLVLPPTWALIERIQEATTGDHVQLGAMAELVAACAFDPENRQPLFDDVDTVKGLRGYEDDISAVFVAASELSGISSEDVTAEKKE